MFSRTKTIVVILVILTVCTLALATGVSVYVNSDHVRTVLLKRINTMIPGTLTASYHHISLLSGEIQIHDLHVSSPQGKPLSGFNRLYINFSLASLLRKTVTIEQIDVQNPWVHLEKNAAGRLNIVDALLPPEENSKPAETHLYHHGFNVILKYFNLSGGDFKFTDGRTGLQFADVNMTAKASFEDKSAVIKLNIGRPSVEFKGRHSVLETFDLALAMKSGHIEPVVMNTKNEFASLLMYGDIQNVFSDPELDLQLNMDMDLALMESFFDVGYNDTGNLKAYLKIKGRPDNPDLELKIGYGGGYLAKHRVQYAEWLSHVKDRLVTIDRLAAETGFGSLQFEGQINLRTAFPEGFYGQMKSFEKVDYEGLLIVDALDLSAVRPWESDVGGILNGNLVIQGKGMTGWPDHAAAELSVSGFRYGGMTQQIDFRLGTVLGLQGDSVRLHHLEAEAEGVYFSADGNLEMENKQIDAHISLTTDQVSGPLSMLGVQGAGGLRLDGNVTGSLENPLLQVIVAGNAIRIQGVSIGDINVEAALNEKGNLTINSLSVANNGSSIKGTGNIQLFETLYRPHPELPLEAGFVFSDLEYGDFMAGPDIKGLMEGSLNLGGSVRSLKAEAGITVGELAVGRIKLGKVAGEVKFRNGRLLVDSLQMKNNNTNLSLKGEAALFQKDSWQMLERPGIILSLSDSRVYLEDFFDDLKGTLVISADLHGDLMRPQGSISVGGKQLELGLQVVEVVALKAVSGNEGITIDTFDIGLPGGSNMAGSGRLGYDKSFQFRLHAEDFNIESIYRVRAMQFAEGNLTFDVTGKGLLGQPEIDGSASLTDVRIKGKDLDEFRVRFDLKDDQASIKGMGMFDLDAGYDLLQKAYSVSLNFNNTNLAPWLLIAGRPELSGTISGEVAVEGHVGDLEKSRASVDIGRLEVDFKGDPLLVSENIRGTLDEEDFEIPGFRIQLLDYSHFSVKGSGNIAGAVNMEVEGDIPLKTAQMLIKDLPEIKGTLALKTSVAGTFKKPRLSGEIRIEQGGMPIPELQQELHNVNGRVILSSENEIEGELSGLLDDGAFDLAGKVMMDGFLPQRVKAKIRAVHLPFQIPETMEMQLNVDLSVNGTMDEILVGGKFVLLEGSYYKDFKLNLMETLQTTKREASPGTGGFDSPLLKPLRFDIHIENRQPFVVDNNIADLEISPDLRLTGTPENPIVTGSAKVDSGIINYQNNSFVVERGAVDFVNPYKTEAEIDIKGEVEIREWRITILVHGPPDHLVVELSSIPHEEDADIISLLVFKKTTYELNEGSGGVAQSPTVILAKLLASSFGDDIKDSTGIDILEVEAESAADEESTDRIKVTVGKNLSERMTVKYSVESGDGGYVQRATTEYKLLENILVSGFQDTKGRYGGELIFRVAFRLFR